MTGARKLARDYIARYLDRNKVMDVLDLCSGDGWTHTEFNFKNYQGLDITSGPDLRNEKRLPHGPFDLILSIYGLQHLMADEAHVWALARRIATQATRFIYVGRYMDFPRREVGRADPLNGYDHAGLGGLALATGWLVAYFGAFTYAGDEYAHADRLTGRPNAFAATLEPLP